MSGPKTSVLSPNFEQYTALSEKAKYRWAQKEILVSLFTMQECSHRAVELRSKLQALQEVAGERAAMLIDEAEKLMHVSFETLDADRSFSAEELKAMKKAGAQDVSYYSGQKLDDSKLEQPYQTFFRSIQSLPMEQMINIARGCAHKAAMMQTAVRQLEQRVWDLEEVCSVKLIDEGVQTSFYLPFRKLRDRGGLEQTIERINAALSEVSDMMLTDAMLMQLRELREKAAGIRDAAFLDSFYQLAVYPFVEKCRHYDAFYRAHFEEYSSCRSSYEILCDELHLVPQETQLSEEGLQFCRTQVEQLQKALLRQRAQEAVMQIVSEVMQEMGYEMVASRDIVRKNGKQLRDELFLYSEGTAISVVQSSEGYLTMEIGALDYGDREPSEQETRQLEQQMQSFCEDYSRIGKTLQERGLDMKHISMLPPDAQYAAILNLEDYQTKGHIQTIKEAAMENRHFTQEQSAQHREEV